MKRTPLSSEVENQIIDLIREKYPPGTKIPIEPELMELFQVSRTTIRAATRALCSRNILEIRRGDGTYVTSKPGLGSDALGLDFLNPENLPDELREVSSLIQPAAASMGAQRITETDITYLKKAIDALEQGYEDYKKGIIDYPTLRKMDSAFHSSVIKTSHNRIIDRLDDVLSSYSAYLNAEVEDLNVILNSLEMHPKIFQAMLDHDSDAAAAAMESHLKNVMLRYSGVQ